MYIQVWVFHLRLLLAAKNSSCNKTNMFNRCIEKVIGIRAHSAINQDERAHHMFDSILPYHPCTSETSHQVVIMSFNHSGERPKSVYTPEVTKTLHDDTSEEDCRHSNQNCDGRNTTLAARRTAIKKLQFVGHTAEYLILFNYNLIININWQQKWWWALDFYHYSLWS